MGGTTNLPHSVDEQICTRCGESQPADVFPRRYRSGSRRHSWCRRCRTAYERQRREKIAQSEVEDHLAQLARYTRDDVAVISLGKVMITRCGGVAGLADRWCAVIEEAECAGNHAVVLRGLTAMINLARAVDSRS